MLSFDVEEYFQVEAAAEGVQREEWPEYEPRLEASIEKILSLLDEFKIKATFFVMGWVAQHEAEVVRRIAEAGHEIASHGMDHQMVTKLRIQDFREQVVESKKILEDLCGQKVVGYRAPTFSIVRETMWALDVLGEAEYEYDSSVFPIRHDRYGMPDAPIEVHWTQGPNGRKILEIPPLVLPVMGMNVPAGGGGYLRLLPVWITEWAMIKAEREGRSGMIYLHPWEFDAEQPVLPMNRMSLLRHRVNLGRTQKKLRYLMERFRFCSVQEWMRDKKMGNMPSELEG
jgi:polysaccharide deacetylase family protein (PEP-CTERM system associated)